MQHFKRIILLSLFMLGLIEASHAAPQANLVPSITSGPAPLAVHFDATGSADSSVSDPFRQLSYRFNFDDSGSSTWAVSGKSKNSQIGGPIAAHVFENPGVYQVSVDVYNASGEHNATTVTITVENPDSVYTGSNTVVISRNSDTTGAPSGAQLITNANSWPSFQSGKRYILMSGQDYLSLGEMQFRGLSNWQVVRLNSGNRPRVRNIWIRDPDAVISQNNTVSGIDLNSFSSQNQARNILLHKSRIRGIGDATSLIVGYGYNNKPSSWLEQRNIFIVENDIDGNSDYGIFAGHTNRFVVMGNNNRTVLTEHGLRMAATYKTFIGHNSIRGESSGTNKSHIKLHGDGLVDWGTTDGSRERYMTRYVVIADNQLGHSSSRVGGALAIAPQNDLEAEGVADVISENNTFTVVSGANMDMRMGGRRITERGNGNPNIATNYHLGNTPGWNGPYYLDDQVIEAPSPPATPVLTIVVD